MTSTRTSLTVAVSVLVVGLYLVLSGTRPAHAATPCDAPVTSPIACENSKPGNPNAEWDITGNGDASIQGFTTDISVNKGGTVRFKIKTDASAYRLDMYRMGYYQGNGARKVATVNPSVGLPQSQPPCYTDASTGLVDCGNWAESASWAVPATAVSGIYFARLIKTSTGGASHIVFVVRDDASTSAVLMQTSDSSWQAYNAYGDTSTNGNSLYPSVNGVAVKVSYNRPFITRGGVPDGRDFVFAQQYPMVRWMEANGYDVSYTTNVDTDRRGALIKQHKLFLSVGHDEYWSPGQRANVEAARDAGVNLAFFSGNSVYWKTRWENSVDGTGTPYRTLVTYKETRANAKVDPDPAWTGTWRDPRFSPPSDGGRPENQLQGTAYKVNSGTFAIEVPEADGKMRLWRNTSVASQAAGATAVLEPETLGYEWDEDLDNGFRPAGLIRLSTTTKDVPEYLFDYGSTVAPGPATHHLTLYRAPSGALVFGAGTIQWTWGLDGNHDGNTSNPDVRMQQATLNLFADMGVQPATIQAGLVPATKSTDTTAPTAVITSPAAGAAVASGSTLTVSGTASDAGGGRVGGVEVSTDNGATWHPATGRTNWTYNWAVTGAGAVTIRVRATDDTANIQPSPATVAVNVSCPCRIFPPNAVPTTPDAGDNSAIEVGVKIQTDLDATISGVRFYKSAANTGTHVGSLWSSTGTKLATATFTGESASGWQQVNFSTPVAVSAFTTYVVSYYAPVGRYAAESGAFAGTAIGGTPVRALKNGDDGGNGVYRYGTGGGFPNQTYGASNYWVDVVVASTSPPDTVPPTVSIKLPSPGATTAPVTAKAQAAFSEPVQASSVSFVLRDASNNPVAGSVGYDAPTRTSTFTPSSPLLAASAYTATVSGAKDLTGNSMAGASTWTFTTEASPRAAGVCPCSIWNDSALPSTPAANDTNGIEVGVKFRADADGTVDGIRFYKGAGNIGPHVGKLWNSSGTLLGSVTFNVESTTGWQQASLATPIPVTAGTTYVVSYYAPNGYYSVTPNYFGVATSNPPLTALAAGTDGQNAVYLYGGGFPTQSYGGGNYWVDVSYSIAPDVTPPTVTSSSPGAGATNVSVGVAPKAVFSEAVQPATVAFSVKDAANVAVAGSVAYDSVTRTATFTPSAPLAAGAVFTASVSGAKDLSGNTLAAPVTWSFTTAGVSACPCTIFDSTYIPATPAANDSSSLEAGVKFRADVDGYVYGVRFYKGAGNTGTHVGTLWTVGGASLASATFTGESASGWQQVTFASAVPVTAGTTYVASYFAPVGRYSADGGYFNTARVNSPLTGLANGTDGGNGVYVYGGGFPTQTYGGASYAVDVSFSTAPPPDPTPPTVTGTSPVSGTTNVSVSVAPKAVFSEAVQPATVAFSVKDAANVAVAGSVAYDSVTRTATFTPSAPLAAGAVFTASVSGAKDLSGNTLAAPVTWSFTTAGVSACPCTIFDSSAVPATPAANDPSAIEAGVKFRADVDGYVYGVRFYKGAGNTGTHVGNLWTVGGVNLATATFAGESASGWQQVTFASPVAVTAGTTYVASYFAPVGRYSADGGFFNTAKVNSPLTGLASGTDGGNGVYRYGSAGFPTDTYGAASYAVDVSFSTTPPPDSTPPTVTGTTPAGGTTNVSVATTTKAVFSEAVQPGTIVFSVKDPANVAVAGSVAYDSVTRTATFMPGATLAAATVYTATVSGAKDLSGNTLTAPVTWSFTTSGGGACPCTIFDSSSVPGTPAANDPSAIEVGVKFRADVNGYVYGVRFYKGTGNTGSHVGNLWTNSGVNLATATFTGESATGWQQVSFATPVAVTAGTTYVASYNAPNGRYAADGGYFNAAKANSPLTGLANGTDGGNGLYLYGTGGFPTQSYGAGNYWVDVSFSTTAPADTTPPTLSPTTPAAGATSVPLGTTVAAAFNEDIQPATLSMTVRDAANATVAGSAAYAAATRTVTFTPTAALAAGTTYTATVSGAKDLAGNTMTAPATWSFTTATAAPPPGTCPCTIWTDATQPGTLSANDPGAIEVGVKFRSDTNGYIYGVRFYKGAGNTGSHVGNLWTTAGVKLATATFTGESTTGWQQVSFASPVAVTANTTYVASYFAPNGRYSADGGYFGSAGTTRGPLTALANGIDGPNAVYLYGAGGFPTNASGGANYWVDVTFATTLPDTTAPTVTAKTPASGASGVSRSTTVSATFSEDVQPATVSLVVKDSANNPVAGTVAYDAPTRTARFTPAATLAIMTGYTATVSGAKDTAGNTMAAPVSWSFTTGLT